MKAVFALLLVLHGAIHALGFLKAFQFSEVKQLNLPISKPMGGIWLLVTILFFISAILYLYKNENWPLMAMISVLISQVIIVLSWQDAKWGTILNGIIILVALQGYAEARFEKLTRLESMNLLASCKPISSEVITEERIASLPAIVQQWMRYSGVIGKPEVVSVRLRQTGEMRTKPTGKWMPFRASQYFDLSNPAFVWVTSVDALPFVSLNGRDKLVHGEGTMTIKLASIFNVVDEHPNEKLNSGTMLRFLGEMCWFPSAALNNYIQWKQLDATSALATFTIDGSSVSGIFTFTETGRLLSFEADRYYGSGETATLKKWYIEPLELKSFEGYKVPSKCEVTWKLDEGEFNWLTLEITAVEYNVFQLY
jgi:hypothetical protein